MTESLKILLTGADKSILEGVRQELAQEPAYQVELRPSGNGQADPLADPGTEADIHIAVLGEAWLQELDTLATSAASRRPPMIAVGPEGDVRVLRKAMQAGARDYLSLPVSGVELRHCLEQISRELGQRTGGSKHMLTAVINAKGGTGASFIATNLAHTLAAPLRQRTALIDLDLQFGAQHLCLDLEPRSNLYAALNSVERLDRMALEGYMTRHASGLRLLASVTDQLVLPWELSGARLAELLAIARRSYSHVVVDLPREIDPLTSTVLERADRILLVVQQSLIHIRDARRMMGILTRDLAIAPDQVRVLINRHDAKTNVSVKDVTQALKVDNPICVPNDFRRVSDAINLGVPVQDSAPSSSVAKAILEMAAGLAGTDEPRSGRLRGMFAGLFGHNKGMQ